MALILPGNVASATAAVYDINNSCKFAYDGDDRMDRTIESPTLGTKWTFSTWIKRDNTGDYHHILTSTDNPGDWDSIRFSSGDAFQVLLKNAATNLTTTQLFRDSSAWYHFVVAYDSTQGTASNRVKLYVNGTQVTAFATANYPDENFIPNFQVSGKTLRIGANTWSIGTGHEKLGGYIAETFFIDGTALAPTAFGEFDSSTPTIWKPKDCSEDFTYGTNGFYLDFADSGDLGDDESGKGNDFAETNIAAADQATDTPTNNFAVYNAALGLSGVLSEGNCKYITAASYGNSNTAFSSIGVQNGKWYAEFLVTATSSGNSVIGAGYDPEKQQDGITNFCQSIDEGWGYAENGNYYNNAATDLGTTYTTDDIVGVALDLDNDKIYWYKNNTLINSGGTDIDSDEVYFFGVSDTTSGGQTTVQANFGNPPTALSSAANDENGYGNFEFAPPSGFLALCTKNLATDG